MQVKAIEQYFHVVPVMKSASKSVDVTRESEFQITATKHAQLSATYVRPFVWKLLNSIAKCCSSLNFSILQN